MKKKNTIYVDTIGWTELKKWKQGDRLISIGLVMAGFGALLASIGSLKQSKSLKWHRAANEEEYKEICDIYNAFETAFEGDEKK